MRRRGSRIDGIGIRRRLVGVILAAFMIAVLVYAARLYLRPPHQNSQITTHLR